MTTLNHYVLIDGHSGYVWDEADASDPIEACKIIDDKVGPRDGPMEYEIVSRSEWNTGNGYFVYQAPADWVPVADGQSRTEIERVEALPLVAKVVCRRVQD